MRTPPFGGRNVSSKLAAEKPSLCLMPTAFSIFSVMGFPSRSTMALLVQSRLPVNGTTSSLPSSWLALRSKTHAPA